MMKTPTYVKLLATVQKFSSHQSIYQPGLNKSGEEEGGCEDKAPGQGHVANVDKEGHVFREHGRDRGFIQGTEWGPLVRGKGRSRWAAARWGPRPRTRRAGALGNRKVTGLVWCAACW